MDSSDTGGEVEPGDTGTPMVYYEGEDENVNSVYGSSRSSMAAAAIIILVVGTIGNLLALIIMRRKTLRIYTTAFLLSLLAISDTACLYIGLLPKILFFLDESETDVFRTILPYSCQIHMFAVYTVLHYTSWLLVLVSVERFVSTWFPQASQKLCSIKSAKIAASVLLPIIASYNTHFFFTVEITDEPLFSQQFDNVTMDDFDFPESSTAIPNGVNGSADAIDGFDSGDDPGAEKSLYCVEKEEYLDFHNNIWPFCDLVLVCFGPFGIMLVTNGLIAWRILQMRQQGDIVVSSASPARRLSGMTIIMFACTLTFLALTFPVNVYILVRRQYGHEEAVHQNLTVVWPVVVVLQYVNNAANFFLYCLTGSMFRRELKRFFYEWASKITAFFSTLYETFAAERTNRNIEAKSNGHLALINIGNGNTINTRANPTTAELAPTSQAPICAATINNVTGRKEAEYRVKFCAGADEPLIEADSGGENVDLSVSQAPAESDSRSFVEGRPLKPNRSSRKLLTRRGSSSLFAAFTRRYKQHKLVITDSEATISAFNSTADMDLYQMAPQPDTSIAKGDESHIVEKRPLRPVASFRYQRRMTIEEKELLDQFGPYC